METGKEVLSMTLDVLITNITSFFTGAISWVTQILTMISSQPILMVLCILIPVAGFAVGLFRRLLNA